MPGTVKYWCIVPAAGVGKRMGANVPKQYLNLLGKTVLEHTLERLLSVSGLSQIVVCVSPGDEYWGRVSLSHTRIKTAEGGRERCDSVLNGLNYLTANGVADTDWVMVHDVVRPCVRVGDIERLMAETADSSVGGILASPVRDTMKRAMGAGTVGETVCRDHLWHALTPQLFRVGMLRGALSKALESGVRVTDESSAIEWAGYRPLLVEGHPDNIKVTHKADLQLAELFIQQQAT